MVAAIFKLITSIPALLELYEKVDAKIVEWKIAQIKAKTGEFQSARDSLTLAIGRAESNEERLNLTKFGYSLSRGEMPAQSPVEDA